MACHHDFKKIDFNDKNYLTKIQRQTVLYNLFAGSAKTKKKFTCFATRISNIALILFVPLLGKGLTFFNHRSSGIIIFFANGLPFKTRSG